jgi:hypothetical protein
MLDVKACCNTPFQHASTALRRVFKIQIAVQNSKSVATGFLAHYLQLEIVKTIL